MTTHCSPSVSVSNPMAQLVPDPAANVCLLNVQRFGFGQAPLTWLSLYGQSQAASALESAGVQSTTLQKNHPGLPTVAATRLMSSAVGQAVVSTHGFGRAPVLGSTVMSTTGQAFGPSGGHPVAHGYTASFQAAPAVPTYGGVLSSPIPGGTPAGASFLG